MERNIKITLEYDGTNYMGWQIQKHGKTIQGTVKEVIEKIVNHKINLVGASRTDAGVHAFGQVANFKTTKEMPIERLKRAINGLLPPDIKVVKTEEVSLSFHSRLDSRGKTYVYRIFNRDVPSPFEYKKAWFISHEIKEAELQKVLNHFIGTHDFTTFSKLSSDEKKNPIRTIDRIDVKRVNHTITITITGRSFLRHMIRVIVATAVESLKGKIDRDSIPELFKKRDRKFAPFLAPPEGLYLMKVYYNDYPF
ncbi:tRNA pseudouridine(38-40) synthase TruA [Desulfurobacterium atlanticum]|uniref:tRNA pseudouridine synthase A n=1 Tax=Desulfurobacterium atlanticum TaxID=240169 RepID=A0A238Y7H5_9BACT|nr:tRNA pseudouridine(38-40) synthase TruA [Desulfurobacterium atlanticum]SNR67047.1 tRNA pseudouridine38-40 synthase [Desulfurobacterium atlanticum]